MKDLPLVVAVLILGSGLSGCEEEEVPPPRYPFSFSATSDGVGLAEVSVSVNGLAIEGMTDEEGMLRADLTGPEGEPVTISAECPDGYRSPTQPQQVTLRQVVSLDPAVQGRGIEVSFQCPPEYREAVVLIRAHDQAGLPRADLPVIVDGTEVTRTDASGTAHVHRRMTPRASFTVMLATAANPRLRPQNPSLSFTIPDRDTVFVFDRQFEEEAPPRVRRRRRRRPPPPRLPIRIGGR